MPKMRTNRAQATAEAYPSLELLECLLVEIDDGRQGRVPGPAGGLETEG